MNRFTICVFLVYLLFSGFFQLSAEAEMRKLDEKSLRTIQGRQGLSLDVNIDADAQFLSITDPGGSSLPPADGSGGSLRFGNTTITNGGSSSFTEVTIDADGSDGLAFTIPSSSEIDVDVTNLILPDDPTSSSLGSADAGELHLSSFDPTGTDLQLAALGEGISASGSISATFNEMYLEEDGDADGGGAGVYFGTTDFGSDNNSDPTDFPSDLDSFSFSNFDVNFDENGIAIEPPSESFMLTIEEVCVNTSSFCSSLSPDGLTIARNLAAQGINLFGSNLLLSGSSDNALEVSGELKFSIDMIQLTDDNGTPENSTSGTVFFDNFRFTDGTNVGNGGGGSAVTIDDDEPVRVNIDGGSNGGLLVELPGFDTSGATFADPNNELYIRNMNVGQGNCDHTSSSCGNWSFRNIDLGGSWIGVRAN